MKTIKDYLNTLPDPIQNKAFKYTPKHMLPYKACDLNEALLKAFFWMNTPEGSNYWSKVYYKIHLVSFNQKIT